MRLRTLEAIFRALEAEEVRYLVIGGLAVNAHGYQRTTGDLVLVLFLSRENVLRALRALEGLGYGPVLPVDAEDFADPATRREWIEKKNLRVFSLASDEHPDTAVDILAEPPFPFEEEHARAAVAEVTPDLSAPFVRLSALIAMKEGSGRPRDRDDVEHLRRIRDEAEGGPGVVRERADPDAEGWDAATWEGSRRAQLRRSLRLTVRERLEELEALTETSERLRGIARPEGGEDGEG